ncbi:MAG: hypothetical protein Q7V01_08940 [Vicinamibacterales bacterium]|nr:hypothetical protein [Vicinamibacterales bacterium]
MAHSIPRCRRRDEPFTTGPSRPPDRGADRGEGRRQPLSGLGTEALGIWINAIGPILLIIGMVGLYVEFKTPGFGLPGIIGTVAFALYFFGGHTAGLSGAGWAVVFVVGLILVVLELFLLQGSMIAGVRGAVLMLVAIVMGMVDVYPGTPRLATLPQLQLPLRDLGIALFGTVRWWKKRDEQRDLRPLRHAACRRHSTT